MISDVEKSRLERGGFSVSSKLSKNFVKAGSLTLNAEFNRYSDTDRHELNGVQDENFKAAKTFATLSGNYSISFGSLNLSAGIKGNFNRIEVWQRVTGEYVRNNYFGLYPSASVNYSFREGKSSLSLAYSSSEFLPSFRNLNPRRIVISDNLVEEGNPGLKPSISHNLNFLYMINSNIIFTVDGGRSKSSYRKYFPENDIMVIREEEGGKRENVVFSISYQNTFFNIWSFRTSVTALYNHAKNRNDVSTNYSFWTPMANVNNTIEFIPGKSWFLSCGYYFRGKIRYFYREEGIAHAISADIRKSFSSGLDLTMGFSKSINSNSSQYFNADTYSYSIRERQSFILYLSAAYMFGNRRVRGASTRQLSGAN